MKKTIFIAMLATTLFACSTTGEKKETTTSGSSFLQAGPEVDLIKKVVTAYSNGDWATMASYYSDTAKSWHNNDTVAMNMKDRIELFKKQRENIDGPVEVGTSNFEVVTVANPEPQYKDIKWGHAWVRFKFKEKEGALKSNLTFSSLAIKDGKIIWEQVIYDTK